MDRYIKAKKVYCRNMLFGIGVGIWFLMNRATAEPLFGFKLGWTLIALIGYGIFAGIRKGNGKEDAYDGKLRILPKIYIGYLALYIVIYFNLYGL